jgi:hypothetical protein
VAKRALARAGLEGLVTTQSGQVDREGAEVDIIDKNLLPHTSICTLSLKDVASSP